MALQRETSGHSNEHLLELLGNLVHGQNHMDYTEPNKINGHMHHFLSLCTGFPHFLLKTTPEKSGLQRNGKCVFLAK